MSLGDDMAKAYDAAGRPKAEEADRDVIALEWRSAKTATAFIELRKVEA